MNVPVDPANAKTDFASVARNLAQLAEQHADANEAVAAGRLAATPVAAAGCRPRKPGRRDVPMNEPKRSVLVVEDERAVEAVGVHRDAGGQDQRGVEANPHAGIIKKNGGRIAPPAVSRTRTRNFQNP